MTARPPGTRSAPAPTPPAVGLDVLDVGELDRLVRRAWFRRYVYAPEELRVAAGFGPERAREFLAGRFAAKEAVLKALGKGLFDGLPPRDIAVGRDPDGTPVVRYRGAAVRQHQPGVRVSITHKGAVVAAVAITAPTGPPHSTTRPADQEDEPMTTDTRTPPSDVEPGRGGAEPITATLRLRIGTEDAHYGGGLVDGARILRLFGDLVTEITIASDGDEGLLAGYTEVRFRAPVRPGDYIEADARLVRSTRLRRMVRLRAHKVIEAAPDGPPSAARRLRTPVLVCEAEAVSVVPLHVVRPSGEENDEKKGDGQ